MSNVLVLCCRKSRIKVWSLQEVRVFIEKINIKQITAGEILCVLLA